MDKATFRQILSWFINIPESEFTSLLGDGMDELFHHEDNHYLIWYGHNNKIKIRTWTGIGQDLPKTTDPQELVNLYGRLVYVGDWGKELERNELWTLYR